MNKSTLVAAACFCVLHTAAAEPAAAQAPAGASADTQAMAQQFGVSAKQNAAEMKDYVEDLAELSKGYLTPSPALLQAFFARVMTAQAPGGWVRLYATDVIAKGDKLVYEIDPKTKAIHRVLFTATLDEDPVDGTVEFATVGGGGPNYASRTTVNAPGKKLTAKIENFEYARQ